MHVSPTYEWQPQTWGSKHGQNMPLLPTQLFFSPLSIEMSFFVLLSLSDLRGGWKWRIKTRAQENKPRWHQVSKHWSPPITTLLDKSLFSQHTASTWCYHFSLNSIKSPLSAQVKKKNWIVLRWAHSFVRVSYMRSMSATWLAEMLRMYCCEKPLWKHYKPLFWFWKADTYMLSERLQLTVISSIDYFHNEK